MYTVVWTNTESNVVSRVKLSTLVSAELLYDNLYGDTILWVELYDNEGLKKRKRAIRAGEFENIKV
jgi:hypothetical protein